MARQKNEVITFKVDQVLSKAMQTIPNRSEFIRSAILAALENACPLCLGSGILSVEQRVHWEKFAAGHSIKKCPDCHLHLGCSLPENNGKTGEKK